MDEDGKYVVKPRKWILVQWKPKESKDPEELYYTWAYTCEIRQDSAAPLKIKSEQRNHTYILVKWGFGLLGTEKSNPNLWKAAQEQGLSNSDIIFTNTNISSFEVVYAANVANVAPKVGSIVEVDLIDRDAEETSFNEGDIRTKCLNAHLAVVDGKIEVS